MTTEDASVFDAIGERQPAAAPARTMLLLEGPILRTLLRLTGPNIGEAAARIAFVVFDAIYVNWLGTDASEQFSTIRDRLVENRSNGRGSAAKARCPAR